MSMGSLNISITENIYTRLKGLKKEEESFSEVLGRLMDEKDISKCYGLLKDYTSDLKIIRAEAKKAREEKWRR